MTKAPRDLNDFLGVWSLNREIDDRHAEKTGTLRGKAHMDAHDGGLLYREEGELVYADGPPLTASRVYLWASASAGMITVSFEDGAAFHEFALDRTMPEAMHFCDPDMYYVTYDFSHWPTWESHWRVVGPKKDYRMVSRYTRLS